jgi:L-2-hydroxyglutarate oxidase
VAVNTVTNLDLNPHLDSSSMRVVVVGAGILGLAVARQLSIERPGWEVTVLEKEPVIASHQTGHNSGVIHAGIYYPPGSLKAQLCRRGGALLREFCDERGVPYDNVGKLVVALEESELDRLAEIHNRALANGVDDVVRVDQAGLRAIEPHAAGIAALHSPSTAMVDYKAVSRAIADELGERGAQLRLSTELLSLRREGSVSILGTSDGDITADEVVVCAGLQSARLAAAIGDDTDPQIIPFRGEYYRLAPEAAAMVRGMIYPVPDPRYPFLGIHLTKRIDGSVDVGPNAVLALALQGYRRRDVVGRDVREILGWPGFRRMALTHWKTGVREMAGSLSKRYYLAQARRYVPELSLSDLMPAPAGVRAQAVRRDGQLVDDFWITRRDGLTLVRNAPSPAATSALAIGEHIVSDLLAAQSG